MSPSSSCYVPVNFTNTEILYVHVEERSTVAGGSVRRGVGSAGRTVAEGDPGVGSKAGGGASRAGDSGSGGPGGAGITGEGMAGTHPLCCNNFSQLLSLLISLQ